MNELTPAVFLDRDGTLMHDTGYVGDPASVEVYPGVSEALLRLKSAGFKTIIVTNQSGIPRGYFTETDFHKVQARFETLVGPGLIDAVYYCAEHPDHATDRRKPGPGMLLEGARDLSLDLARSWMVGDRAGDVEAGVRAGVRTILALICRRERGCVPDLLKRVRLGKREERGLVRNIRTCGGGAIRKRPGSLR